MLILGPSNLTLNSVYSLQWLRGDGLLWSPLVKRFLPLSSDRDNPNSDKQVEYHAGQLEHWPWDFSQWPTSLADTWYPGDWLVHPGARESVLAPRRGLIRLAVSLPWQRRIETSFLLKHIHLNEGILNLGIILFPFPSLKKREVGSSSQQDDFLNCTIKLQLIKLGYNCHLLGCFFECPMLQWLSI